MFYAKVVTAVLAWVVMVAFAMPWLIDDMGFYGAITAAVLTLVLMGLTWKAFANIEEEQHGCCRDHECYDPACRNGCTADKQPPSCGGSGGCC